MDTKSNVTDKSSKTQGLLFGFLGVLAFSFTVPLTRVAVADLDPTFVGLGRALVAAALAALLLAFTRQRLPERRHWPRLVIVGSGVIVGFPLFTSLALRELPAADAAVIVGLLPAATAVMAVLRAGERPSRAFWGACAFGLLAVLLFAASQGAGLVPDRGHLLVLLAVALCSLGYAEGGALAQEIGGWRVISWSLVVFAPFLAPFVAWSVLGPGGAGLTVAGPAAWACFAYVSVVSMFLGFFAWYRGLAEGGVARVGQVQLSQPVLTLLWSALLLGERVGPFTVLCAVLVLASVAVGQRTRVNKGGARTGKAAAKTGREG
ncbi:MAG: DMT family transporter [Actinomycetota bacterium]|nr:DMT family transporter [Actinomycetota bacterium]MDP9484341.1 DMT family transporter [Actinomycetota bacterium]